MLNRASTCLSIARPLKEQVSCDTVRNMSNFTAADLAAWTGGSWRTEPPPVVRGVSTDTRSLASGEVYVALVGPHFDGHDFLGQAWERGAAGAIVDAQRVSGLSPAGRLLGVPNTESALTDIASHYRGRLKGRIIGISGSVAKTTVKELVGDVVSRSGATTRTHGNWNNQIGLPLSLLRMSPHDDYGVFELGMNHPGELAGLCRTLRPVWGIMTPVGLAHHEFFASVEAIAQEKATLFRELPADGCAFVSRDQEWFSLLKDAASCAIVTTSARTEADYFIIERTASMDQFVVAERFTGDRESIRLPVPGPFMVENALLAIAVGRKLGLGWGALGEALSRYAPPPMRWQRTSVGAIHFINDAYNANPMSMQAGLRAFAGVPCEGRKWLVLGSMFELGEVQEHEHRELGRLAAKGDWAGLVAVGRLGHWIAEGALSAGWAEERVVLCVNAEDAARVLLDRVGEGDLVLLKASRGEELERVLEIVKESGSDGRRDP